MKSQDDSSPQHLAELPTSSAFKTLEVLLHSLDQNFSKPVGALLNDSIHLSASQRLLVTNINESVERMALMLKNTLRQRAAEEGGNFSKAAEDVVERVQVEKVLRALAMTTSSQESSAFFNYCVQSLAELYGCAYAFIGLIMPSGDDVETLAVWAGDGLAENFEYNLEGTPCADIINYKKELIPTNAAKLYPEDELLVHMNVDSYFGAPILSADSGVIGLVSVMDTKPMVLSEWVAPVLGVFASRLALEIQRKTAVDELRHANETLEQRVEERTRELENANKELQAFSYTVSHDLRAPVRAINSFVDIVFEDFGDELAAECRDHLGRVQRAGRKLDGLIDDILKLSQVSAAQLLFKRIDITAMASEILDALAENNPDRNVSMSVQSGMTGWGDKGLTGIVLQNLIGNAWKYSSGAENASICVDSIVRDGVTIFRVQDNGIGFDMAYVKNVFKPFQRLHTEETFKGNGIGLATTQRIIHRHGGDIWANSEEGKGAIFCFTLGCQAPIRRKHQTD